MNATVIKVKDAVKKHTAAFVADVKTWRIGEWGSVASIMGVGLWVYDKAKQKKR